ncbi:GlcG/HbpS family heme-binding protein [Mixta intestinalis]|jgi:uncharacterized protein GlcG (DUF336 family)|uniref:Heme-binding protein n=1 Tax=Mixta intestinalis TaxID=1615494 RepID=A0A6P1PTY4_9GAMM|nr:heme-binding protein [Mixta intestinalis]QHM69920.1 hypothetical protein C7M51_00179 [Mixta intestinalis]
MKQALHSDIEQRINEAVARHLAAERRTFNLNDAALLAACAREAAESCRVPIVFSLVDAAGQQRYFFSMDNALLVSHTLAGQKAWTAAAMKMATHELTDKVQSGGPLYGLQHTPGVCCLGGGLPCWSQGVLLGAIGISGGSVEEDIAIASAALARFSREHFPLTPSV